MYTAEIEDLVFSVKLPDGAMVSHGYYRNYTLDTIIMYFYLLCWVGSF